MTYQQQTENDSISKKNEFYQKEQELTQEIDQMKTSLLNEYNQLGKSITKYFDDLISRINQESQSFTESIESSLTNQEYKNSMYSELIISFQYLYGEIYSYFEKYYHELTKANENLLGYIINKNNFYSTQKEKLDLFLKTEQQKKNEEISEKKNEQIQQKKNEQIQQKKNEETPKPLETISETTPDIILDKLLIDGKEGINDVKTKFQTLTNNYYKKIVFINIEKENFDESTIQKNYTFQSKQNDNIIVPGNNRTFSGSTFSTQQHSFDINRKTGYIDSICDQISNFQNNFKQINSDKVKNLVIKDSNLEDINLGESFPNLEKLKIRNVHLSFDLKNIFKFSKLSELILENLGLINENFVDLFISIRDNDELRTNLKKFSIKKNNVSFIDFYEGLADNQTKIFDNLNELDFSFNKFYFFQTKFFNCVKNIKLIDLTHNNIDFITNFHDFLKSAKSENCLVLMTNNIVVLKEDNNVEYNKYLIEVFPKVQYDIKKLTLDGIFFCENANYLNEINLNTYNESLIYLNLSNGQLTDKSLINLMNSSLKLLNLKDFILEQNKLTEKFLELLIDYKKNNPKFDNLRYLNISSNTIKFTVAENYKNFFEYFKSLKIFEICNTPMETIINDFMRKKVRIFYGEKQKTKAKVEKFNKEDKEIEKIIDGDGYLEKNTQLTIKIMDLINLRYTSKIKQNFPELLKRLIMENKFPQPSG